MKLNQLPIFWRRVSVVVAGTVGAQIIPLAVLPLLTRKLSPAVLGQYFTWLGIATVASVVATLRLDVAIFNATTKKELASLLLAALFTSIIFLLLGPLILVLASKYFHAWFASNVIGRAVWFAIPMATMLAIVQTTMSVYTYSAHFRRQAIAKIAIAASVALLQLVLTIRGYGFLGLIAGQLIATLLLVLLMQRDIWKLLDLRLSPTPIRDAGSVMRANWRFPVIAMPADFVNSFATQLPLILVGNKFGASNAGQFALTNRALVAPVGLLAGSILSVFKEEASREYRSTGQCKSSYLRALKSLVLIGLVPFLVVFFGSEWIFVRFFGSNWHEAGRIAAILSPMFYLKFVASPLSYTLYLSNGQIKDLLWQLSLLTLTIYSFAFTQDLYTSIAIYSLGYSALYVFYIFLSYSASLGSNK